MICGHIAVSALRSLASVSVIATYGSNLVVETDSESPGPSLSSQSRQHPSSSARILVSYPACVARFPVGAENRNIATGIPLFELSTPRAIHSSSLELHSPNVPSKTSCFV